MLLRKFSWLYRCANWRYRDFFAAENIKDIKSFRAKMFGFNISGNYSGRSRMRVNVARVALGLYQIWKTKTGKTPCAWCKMALTSHWCCDWLKIPELARGIFSQSQYQWLVRAILHQAQGVFPVFVFLAKTRVSWCHIIYKVFSFHWVTRPRATCGTLRFQWKTTWVVNAPSPYFGKCRHYLSKKFPNFRCFRFS